MTTDLFIEIHMQDWHAGFTGRVYGQISSCDIRTPCLRKRRCISNCVRSAAQLESFQPLESSLGRVPQAADCVCRRASNERIVSVAEDCLSPERTFHGCALMYFRNSFPWLCPLSRCSLLRSFDFLENL